jgi:hypothetical protein
MNKPSRLQITTPAKLDSTAAAKAYLESCLSVMTLSSFTEASEVRPERNIAQNQCVSGKVVC